MSHYTDYYNISNFRPQHLEMLDKITELGPRFCERAVNTDLNAEFPTENYQDLAEQGFLKLVIPEEYGGYGFSLGEYATIGAEIGKYCGATALTFNMHTSSMNWLRHMYEMPNLSAEERADFARMRDIQFPKVVDDNAIFSQPISEGGVNWTSDPIRTNCKRVDGGWVINGMKKFASLAGHCDYYSIVCTEHFDGQAPRHEDTMDFAVHKDTPGLSIKGEWDPLGMRGTVSRDLILKDVFVAKDDLMMPAGVFTKTLAQWPAMMATLTPAYMGIAQSAYDFTVQYLRGETPNQPPIDRRVYPTKRATVGRMYQRLTEMRSLWHSVFSEACHFPSKAQVMRIYAAQYAVMEGVQEIAALAIRTCGGQSMLKSLPLERIYRDSRCGALMLPYTTEIMEDYLSVMTVYDMEDIDEIDSNTASARISLWRPEA
ncbi:MAG: acyl-CoA dehydrogenase [Gammaproteobacteria bacterium]|nr:acyl-CoA dehydrogenase [Gammaproteobacteria bacterium]